MIRAVAGENFGPVQPLRSLSHHDSVAALRRNTSAAACLGRLQAAARSSSVVDPDQPQAPLLGEMPRLEGKAGEWCLAVARDFWDHQGGHIQFRSVVRNAVFVGEPGMGKTLLARPVACSLGISLIETSITGWLAPTQGYASRDRRLQAAGRRRR